MQLPSVHGLMASKWLQTRSGPGLDDVDTLNAGIDIRACSVHHMTNELMPKANLVLQSGLADSNSPIGLEPHLQSTDEATFRYAEKLPHADDCFAQPIA